MITVTGRRKHVQKRDSQVQIYKFLNCYCGEWNLADFLHVYYWFVSVAIDSVERIKY